MQVSASRSRLLSFRLFLFVTPRTNQLTGDYHDAPHSRTARTTRSIANEMSSNTTRIAATPARGEIATAATQPDARATFTDLPRDIINQILGAANLPDPADLARLRAVNRAMHDAVAKAGRIVKDLTVDEYVNLVDEYVELGCLSALKRLYRSGRLSVLPRGPYRLRWRSYESRDESLCDAAARSGQLEELKVLRANGSPWHEGTCASAALGGHLDVLHWLSVNGCRWNHTTCSNAAKGGHLEVLKWARENWCNWDVNTCSNAALGGHLEVLQWARRNGCPWGTFTCALAAEGGHLDVLRWARANECPWDSNTCRGAAKGGHLDVLQWARTNGCLWTEETCSWAAKGG
jgi:hypothetical protein